MEKIRKKNNRRNIALIALTAILAAVIGLVGGMSLTKPYAENTMPEIRPEFTSIEYAQSGRYMFMNGDENVTSQMPFAVYADRAYNLPFISTMNNSVVWLYGEYDGTNTVFSFPENYRQILTKHYGVTSSTQISGNAFVTEKGNLQMHLFQFEGSDMVYNSEVSIEIYESSGQTYFPRFKINRSPSDLMLYKYLFYLDMPYSLSPPEVPEKEGHTFVGWYLDEALTIPYNGEPVTADMTFYAKYEINKYTLTLDANGGNYTDYGATKTKIVEWHATNYLSAYDTPLRHGYTFIGYLYESGAPFSENSHLFEKDLKIIAQWERINYTVTFDTDGGNVVDAIKVDFQTPWADIELPTPEKAGHTFKGWTFADGSEIIGLVDANTSVKALWQINTYTVKYLASGGTVEKESEIAEYGSTVTLPTAEREGYIFLGWFVGGTRYTNELTVLEDTNVIARWQVKVYTVTFVIDGEIVTSFEVAHGTTFQTAMQSADLTYYHLLNNNGQVIAKGDSITSAVTVPIGEMTTEEKVATFIGNNWWLLWALGCLAVAGIAAAVIASIVAHKRK